ncbi:MAG: glycosyltransferase [Bryobacteraceae bacterium]
MIWIPIAICAVAAAYQLLAIAACLIRKRPLLPTDQPPVSILKPIRGVAPELTDAIASHLNQSYPEFELLLGIREDDVGKLHIADPRVRVIVCHTVTPNRKVGTLIDLAREARHPVLIVNDADITVPSNYIRDVVSELAPSRVGLVTCLYRARSRTWPGRWEALGVATDFAPSALVAPFVGVSEFGLGSTLAFRRTDLEKIGGFEAIADYLADDYQLGCHLHALGRRNVIARPIVTTTLSASTWSAGWRHQVRWSRTVRLSRTGGYLGLPVTFATLWALLAACCGLPAVAVTLLLLRLVMAVTAGYGVLRSSDVLKYFYLIPFRDLYTVAIWVASLFGNTVEWGGKVLKLDRNGRIMS